MKALRHPAAPIIPAPPFGFTLPRHLKIPKNDILPLNLLDNSRTNDPNELLKTKDRKKKDVKNEGSSQ
jgi:hypothetical protein